MVIVLIIYSIAIWYALLVTKALIKQIISDKENWKYYLKLLYKTYLILIAIGWMFFIMEVYKICSNIIVKEPKTLIEQEKTYC